jgi:hypothetical protein
MARNPNRVTTVTITISTTQVIEAYLDELVGGGLYGKNPAEAAERLVARGIENLVRDGTLVRGKPHNPEPGKS